MNMLPIFLCGILLGSVFGYVCSLHKMKVPSQQELNSLIEENNRLREELQKLKESKN